MFVEAWLSLLFRDAVVCLFLFKDFVVVFVEAWLSLLFHDAVVCLFLFYGLCCCVCRGLVVIAVSRCCCLFVLV